MTDPDHPGRADAHQRVSIANEQPIEVDEWRLSRLAARALDLAGVPKSHSLSVALVTRGRIAELKGRYYGEAKPTDVLAFAMDPLDAPAPAILGDVVICVDIADRQARALGLEPERELEHLLVHGILHLAGQDHADVDGELRMAAEERRILREATKVAS